MSTTSNILATAAAAVLLFSGSAFAMSAFAAPVAGNAPYFDSVATTSQLQRSAVEAQALAHPPATGEFSAWRGNALPDPDLTRADVESGIHALPRAGESA